MGKLRRKKYTYSLNKNLEPEMKNELIVIR
jgi:hypothetical protein